MLISLILINTLSVVLTKEDVINVNNKVTPNAIKADREMVTDMDTFEVIKKEKWNGKKADIWQMKYTSYPYYNCGKTFTEEEKLNIVNENTEYMTNLVKYANEGTLKRMDPLLGGEQQYDADSITWPDYRIKVRYGVMPRTKGKRAIAGMMPGDVVTIKFPTGFDYTGVLICVGKCQKTASHQWLNVAKFNSNRMPIDSIDFSLTNEEVKKYIVNDTIKVGNPFGGNLYIDSAYRNDPFYVEIDNLVYAPIVRYGDITNKEWEETLRYSVGTVAEYRSPGNRMVLASRYIRQTVDAEKFAKFWAYSIFLSEHAVGKINFPITMNYDYRVDCGAACAFVGRFFCQNPVRWAAEVTNIDYVLEYGSWGSLHEMNHHMQNGGQGGRWGINNPAEVTNNFLTAATYMTYTNIAGHKSTSLSGWNYVSDGYYLMSTIYNGVDNSRQLRSYVSLGHGFGPDAMIKLVRTYYEDWYNEDYQNVLSINRNTESAFCLLAAHAIKRDTRYLCSLFNYTIVDAVDKKIESFGYETYYPIFNKYTLGFNGVNTSRPYLIPVNRATRLNFYETTAIDKKATNVRFELLGLEKGRLDKIEEGIYDYTPKFPANEKDSFTLIVYAQINGNNVKVTLNGEFVLDTHSLNIDVYKPVESSKTMDDMEQAINEMDVSFETMDSFLGISSYNDGRDMSVRIARGKLVVPEDGYYTFFMKADDMGRFFIEENGELVKKIEVTTYSRNYNKENENSYFTMKMDSGKEYPFELRNFNTGGPGSIRIGYCYFESQVDIDIKSCTINDVPSNMIINSVSSVTEVLPKWKLPEIKYYRQMNYVVHTIKPFENCVDEENCFAKAISLPPPAGDRDSWKIFDGDTSTFYHTRYSTATEFPATFAWNFTHNVTFNSIYFHHRRSIDSFGTFDIIGKSGKEEKKLIKTYVNEGLVSYTINFDEIHTIDYLEFNVKNNSKGNRYVVLAEVKFGLTREYMNYTNSVANEVKSNGFKNVTAAGCAGNVYIENTESGKGSIEFILYGKAFGLYGFVNKECGNFEVYLDGELYGENSCYQDVPSYRNLYFTHEFENKGEHKVMIKVIKGFVNLDFVGFE